MSDIAVVLLGFEIGYHTGLLIGMSHGFDPRVLPYPGIQTIRSNDQCCLKYATVFNMQMGVRFCQG